MQEITTFLMFDGKAEEAIEALFNKLSGASMMVKLI